MSGNHDQRGEGRVSFIFALAVAVTLVFVAIKVIPVRVAAYQFRDTLRQEARYGAVRDSDDMVTTRILEKASDLQIPLDRKSLSVQRSKSEIIIRARYEQPIDFKLGKWVYHFDQEERAPLF